METIKITRGIDNFPKTIIDSGSNHQKSIVVKTENLDVDLAVSFAYSQDGINTIPLTDSSGNAIAMTIPALTGKAGLQLTDFTANKLHITFAVTGGKVLPVLSAVTTGTVSQIAADITATVNPGGSITSAFVEIGTESGIYPRSIQMVNSPTAAGTSPVSLSLNVTGLEQDTVYFYRIKAYNSVGVIYSDVKTFTTTEALEAVITEVASGTKTQLTAPITAKVNPGGSITSVFVEVGTITGIYTRKIPVTESPLPAGLAAVDVSVTVTGLTPNTPYFFRIVAESSAGIKLGTEATFSTIAGVAPVITPVSPANITANTAGMLAKINPKGLKTNVVMEYGIATGVYTESLQAHQSPLEAGIADINVTQVARALTASTTYYYRIKATNSAGTINGTEATFTTTA